MKNIITCMTIIFLICNCVDTNKNIDINLWYGDHQTFGIPGNTQRWVNVLGNVQSQDSIVSLSYILNDANFYPLSVGSDLHRLAANGDFNIEIDTADLIIGENKVLIQACTSKKNCCEKAMTIQFVKGNIWPLPYEIDWQESPEISSAVQVVDGKWKVENGVIRNKDIYYDRVFSLGDSTWRDVEVMSTVTLKDFTPKSPGPPSYNVSHFAIASRWPGHDVDEFQPNRKWYPLGATSEFTISKNLDSCRWRMFTAPRKEGRQFFVKPSKSNLKKIEINKKYRIKHRVETISEDSTQYSVKLWEYTSKEPEAWDLQGVEINENIKSGSVLFLAHHTLVEFGNIKVKPL